MVIWFNGLIGLYKIYILYLLSIKGFIMTMKTKVFKSGNSQAIRIPKELRFDCNEVTIEKIDDTIVIKGIKNKQNKWDIMRKSLQVLQEFDFDLEIEDLPIQQRDLL